MTFSTLQRAGEIAGWSDGHLSAQSLGSGDYDFLKPPQLESIVGALSHSSFDANRISLGHQLKKLNVSALLSVAAILAFGPLTIGGVVLGGLWLTNIRPSTTPDIAVAQRYTSADEVREQVPVLPRSDAVAPGPPTAVARPPGLRPSPPQNVTAQ